MRQGEENRKVRVGSGVVGAARLSIHPQRIRRRLPTPALQLYCLRPVAAEDFYGGACLVDGVVPLVPLQVQVAAEEMVDDLALGASCEHAGDANGAGTG